MRKWISLAFCIMFVLLVIPVNNTLASDYNWTTAFATYLDEVEEDIIDNNSKYKYFALYDIEGDGTPELFLKSESGKNDYMIVRCENSSVIEEKIFSTDGLYIENKTNDLIISYTNSSGTYYVRYDKNKNINISDQVYKSRPYREEERLTLTNIYFIGNKEVTKEVFEKSFKNNLTLLKNVFIEIENKNISHIVYAGIIDTGVNPSFTGSKIGVEPNHYNQIAFNDGTDIISESFGEKNIYSLLMVNGDLISNTYSINENGNTLIPVRVVSENLDAQVDWVGSLQKITIKGNSKIEMYVGKSDATVDGKNVEMSVPAKIVDGVTYVPARFVAENLNADIYFWEGSKKIPPIINIEDKGKRESLSDREAVAKAKSFLEDGSWVPNQKSFSKAHMAKNLIFKSEDLALGRYYPVVLDIRETQRLFIDRYTGQVYSVYEGDVNFGISSGIDGVVLALVEEYLQ